MTALFSDKGYVCIVEKDQDELDEHFILRGNFICKQHPKTDLEYATCVTYSRIYINVILNKCTYGREITDTLNKFIGFTKPCTK